MLAHTGDMDVVPTLIDVLMDQDDDVVNSARLGLQILSRNIVGLGPPTPSTPEQRLRRREKWREWFNAIRPLDLDDDDNPAPDRPQPARRRRPARRQGVHHDDHRQPELRIRKSR